ADCQGFRYKNWPTLAVSGIKTKGSRSFLRDRIELYDAENGRFLSGSPQFAVRLAIIPWIHYPGTATGQEVTFREPGCEMGDRPKLAC
ncbi:MAG: hypothetical protein WD049_06575, partial [Candidatus Paceibacterota bacterium]